jgi:hypothetical protein
MVSLDFFFVVEIRKKMKDEVEKKKGNFISSIFLLVGRKKSIDLCGKSERRRRRKAAPAMSSLFRKVFHRHGHDVEASCTGG